VYHIDELDHEIIRRLQADGRASNVDVARSLGVAEATVRKRLERLTEEGILSFSGCVDPKQVGLKTHTIMLIKVEVGQVEKAGHTLAKMAELRCVHFLAGEYDLMAEGLFCETAALTRFLTEKLSLVPGILHISTSHVLETFKKPNQWLLPEAAPPRILVVDDDPDFVSIARQVLKSERMDVVSASNAEDALVRARSLAPDLIIMDVMMKGVLDGVDATRDLRKERDLADVPVLMITSIPDSEHAGLFPVDEDLPIDQLLSKPVSPDRLVSEVRRLLKRR
jgi:CheY-like chemotaxis protein/DNA-binding Lrp family transcriptional regulator